MLPLSLNLKSYQLSSLFSVSVDNYYIYIKPRAIEIFGWWSVRFQSVTVHSSKRTPSLPNVSELNT